MTSTVAAWRVFSKFRPKTMRLHESNSMITTAVENNQTTHENVQLVSKEAVMVNGQAKTIVDYVAKDDLRDWTWKGPENLELEELVPLKNEYEV